MRRVLLMLGASCLALSACKAASTASDERVMLPPAAAQTVSARLTPPPAADAVAASGAAANAAVQAAPPPSPAATPLLAYSYSYGIEAPPENIRPLVTKEEAACATAGVAACEITGLNISELGSDQVQAHLTLKATPAWLTGYEGRLASDAQGAGGKLTRTEVTTEDLSRQIIDTQAAVAAKTALRDRLQQMLQTRQGNLADLLAVQEKLADVQGDLDATNSELAAMKERIATSDVTIDYGSTGVLAPRSAWAPIGGAVDGASSMLAGSIALLIYVVAFLLPWALIVGGLLWLFRKRLFRKRPPKPVPANTNPPAP